METPEIWKYLFIAGVLLPLVGLFFPSSKKASDEDVPGLEPEALHSPPDGRCLVCRDALAGELVECRSCRTPHHRDCWDYVGSCSIYGCRALWCTSLEVRR